MTLEAEAGSAWSLRLVDAVDLWDWGGKRVRLSRSKRLETELEDEEEHFLNVFSFLANVSTYAAHLCTPASAKDFFIWVYLFVPSRYTG